MRDKPTSRSLKKRLKARSQQEMEWTGTMITITQEDKEIIFDCKESALFNDNSPWV